jgi:hypothetical protein
MKNKLTLIAIQLNKSLGYADNDYMKVFFTSQNELPSITISTKDEKDSLKDLFSRYFNVDYKWFEKEIYDFRIVNNDEERIAETVYITYTPEVISMEADGKFLTFQQMYDKNIKLENFYERGITGSGKSTFR